MSAARQPSATDKPAARQLSWLRSTRTSITLMLVSGLLASVAVYLVAAHADGRRRELEFDRLTSDRFGVVRGALDAHIGALHSLRALFLASHRVDRGEFSTFARELVRRHPGVQALEWIPLVRAEQRAAFEAVRRSEGFADFVIREVSPDGEMVAADRRDVYFPVDYVEPAAGNERAIGFDLASDAIRRDAIERARRSGVVAATAGITLVQDAAREHSFLLVLPVEKQEQLQGFVLGVFRVRDLLGAALKELGHRPIEILVTDQTEPAEPQLLTSLIAGRRDPSRQELDSSWRRTELTRVADRIWLVECIAGSNATFVAASKVPLLLAALGLLLTAFLVHSTSVRERVLAGSHREALQREFAQQIVDAQEQERKGLAQELHDGVAQDLAAVSLYAQLECGKYESDVAAGFGQLHTDVARSVAELRRLSYGLHPLELEDRGLLGAVAELARRTRAANPSLVLHFDPRDEAPALGKARELGVYRIVQESLSNALRHARAHNVWVAFSRSGTRLTVSVRDDGVGFDAARGWSGLGLRSMRERAAFLEAGLTIDSDGNGTSVELVLPVAPDGRGARDGASPREHSRDDSEREQIA